MKTPNFKPGDIAIIVSPNHPENLGRLVRVVEDWSGREYHAGSQWGPSDERPRWLVEFVGDLGVSRPIGRSHPVNRHRSGPCLDQSLRPLPEENTVMTHDKEEESRNA